MQTAVRRQKQYHLANNLACRLSIAKMLLAAKLYNSRRALQRLCANRAPWTWPSEQDTFYANQLKWIAQHITDCATPSALCGMEGLGAMHYFSLLSHFFPKTVPFNGRKRRPPKDPANTLLSWTYTLILSEMVTAIHSHGLDPAMGFLHVNANRSPALALDLMEPFRPCADLLVLNLFNHHIIRPDEHFTTSPSGRVSLNEDGRTVFFTAYENALLRPFKSVQTGERSTLRVLIHQQVIDFVHALEAPLSPSTSLPTFRLP